MFDSFIKLVVVILKISFNDDKLISLSLASLAILFHITSLTVYILQLFKKQPTHRAKNLPLHVSCTSRRCFMSLFYKYFRKFKRRNTNEVLHQKIYLAVNTISNLAQTLYQIENRIIKDFNRVLNYTLISCTSSTLHNLLLNNRNTLITHICRTKTCVFTNVTYPVHIAHSYLTI